MILKKLHRQLFPSIWIFIACNINVFCYLSTKILFSILKVKKLHKWKNNSFKANTNWFVSWHRFYVLLFQWPSLGVLGQAPATESWERAHASWRGRGTSCQEVGAIIAKIKKKRIIQIKIVTVLIHVLLHLFKYYVKKIFLMFLYQFNHLIT